MSIFDLIMTELDDRGVYKYKTYAPFFISSFAMHVFNLYNQRQQIYWETKRLPNMRTHLLFVAPPGFMKSFYMSTMGSDKYSILRKAGIKIGSEQYMCLPAGQQVQMSDGPNKNIEDICIGDNIMSFNDNDIISTLVTDTHNMISDQLLQITLQDGRKISLTPNHPVYTINGWIDSGDLEIGNSIAVPRIYNVNVDIGDEYFSLIMGYMLADGNFSSMNFYNVDKNAIAEFTNAVEHLGQTVRQTPHDKRNLEYHIYGEGSGRSNIIKRRFNDMGLTSDCVRDAKFIPNEVFGWNNKCISNLLRGLFTGDGYADNTQIIFTNLSEQLCRGIQQLLLRFGILSRVWFDDSDNQVWKVLITTNKDMIKFNEVIGFAKSVDIVKKRDLSSIGSIPGDIWDIIDNERGWISWKYLGEMVNYTVYHAMKRRGKISNELLSNIAEALNSDKLRSLIMPNIAWIPVTEIAEMEGERVYNLSTENHTFIAQNIITHNTEAGFVGTMQNIGGVSVPVEGAAKMYADGFIIIDEFSAITKALQMQHSNQLDNQLLSALDHGHVTKRLGSGKIEFDTRMTLWAGVQPARFDLTSGMGRRLMYMVFIPSKLDNEYLMDSMHASRNLAPNKVHMNNMWSELRQFKQDVEGIQTIKFDDSVLAMYKELGLYSFEGSYFDRLLIGYQLAMYGPEKHITISMKDPELVKLIVLQKKWRTEIASGIEFVQLTRIIEMNGGTITKQQLVDDSAMYGWNAMQVFELLREMKTHHIISVNKGIVEIL